MTTFKFPKALGACADLVYSLRQERLAAQKVVDALEEKEKALREHIINTLPKSEATGAAGKLARVTVMTKDVPQVKDWEKFYAYVKKNNAWDLMQRRRGRRRRHRGLWPALHRQPRPGDPPGKERAPERARPRHLLRRRRCRIHRLPHAVLRRKIQVKSGYSACS